MSADVTVRVGAFTIPVYVTGNLQGLTEGEEIGLADIAALKAGSEDSILVDAGGSLQGTARASLTGGMDMTPLPQPGMICRPLMLPIWRMALTAFSAM